MLTKIAEELKKDSKNYELFVQLADYYTSTNLNKSGICLKQALYYCNNEEEKKKIEFRLSEIHKELGIRKTSIVILSYNTKDTTKMCLDYLFENCDKNEVEVIVVDNASSDGSTQMLKEYSGIKLVENSENRGFPGGCNDGIEVASKENDVLLLNSDAFLLPNSLFWIKMGLYESENVGCTGSVTNYAGNYQMVAVDCSSMDTIKNFAMVTNVPLENPYAKKIYLIGFCMLIKREALEKVGGLDEQFFPGNFEDTDYGVRMINENYEMLLCKNSFVYHHGHQSFRQLDSSLTSVLEKNLKKFIDKWHLNITYYTHTREELVDFIQRDSRDKFNALEVGCGCGCTIGYLEGKYPNADIEGIELDEEAAKIGSKAFKIYQDNFETPKREYKEGYYDYVIFGDVLEHLYDPSKALRRAYQLLKPDGYVITSIQNLLHVSVVQQLLNGRFDYAESGILDRTHIRFFTLETMIELFLRSGYTVVDLKGVINDKGYEEYISQLMPIMGENVSRSQLETYQYYLFAKKK